MPCIRYCGALSGKTNCTAITAGRRLTVDRRGQGENTSFSEIETPATVIYHAGLMAHGRQNGIVKFLRRLDIICADHYVTEHSLLSSFKT
jgi:hypothetical protein